MFRLFATTIGLLVVLHTSQLSADSLTSPALAPYGSLSLAQLMALAQRDNKDIQAARYAVDIGRARLVQAGLLPNPRLDLGARSDVLFRNEGEFGNSIGLSQQFPIAGRVLSQKAVARVDVALAQAEVEEAERKLYGDIATDTYRLLIVERQIQLRDEQGKAESKLAKTTRHRFKAAEVSELDVNAVELDLQRLAQERALLNNQRVALLASLNTRLGRPASASLSIRQTLSENEVLPDEDQLQAQALRSRPDLRSVLLGVDRAQAEKALARAQRWEDWNVSVALSQDKLFVEGAPPQQASRAIGVNLSIPLPLFNKSQGLLAEAEATSSQAISRYEALRLNIASEVSSAYVEASSLQQQLAQYHQTLLPVSQRSVQLAQKGYAQGLVSILEVMQAQRQQADLNAAYLNTLGQFAQVLARLHTAIGDYLVTVPTGSGSDNKDA